MFPGKINPKQMQQMMKSMGIKSETIPAERVVIELADKKIVIDQPNVSAIEAQGQKTYTVMGSERVEESISNDDIALVMEKTGSSREKAAQALHDQHGDIAEAILTLQSKN